MMKIIDWLRWFITNFPVIRQVFDLLKQLVDLVKEIIDAIKKDD